MRFPDPTYVALYRKPTWLERYQAWSWQHPISHFLLVEVLAVMGGTLVAIGLIEWFCKNVHLTGVN